MMFQYKCLNPISPCGTSLFTEEYKQVEELQKADAVLVRSAAMHDMQDVPNLLAVARAGAGVNNIPIADYSEKGIVVFNTPGANANGVKEMVIAGMLLASRDLIGGNKWVEENKDAAHNLNMEVYGYDPFLSVKSAWNLSRAVHHVSSIDEIFENCDFITIHVPLLDSTKNMISAEGIAKMKKDAVILNFARNGLVDEDALVAALDNGKLAHYVTDFPTPKVAGVKGVIAFPHLGASTEESEDNCAEMAVDQLMDYLENGNITNSVNYPNTQLGVCQTQGRIAILHRNIPNMLTRFTGAFAKDNINITEMSNKTKGDYAYAIFDVDSAITEESVQHIIDIEGVLKVRVVK